MKTKVCITLAILLFTVLSVKANKDETVIFTNIETVEKGNKVESITCHKNTLIPIKRIVGIEDVVGNLIENEQYQWNGGTWTGVKKVVYEYTEDAKIQKLVTRKWDTKQNRWEKNSIQVTYVYDENGKLSGTQQVMLDK